MALIREADPEVLDWVGRQYDFPWVPDGWTLGNYIAEHGDFYYAVYREAFYGWVAAVRIPGAMRYTVDHVHFDNLSCNDRRMNGIVLYACFRDLIDIRVKGGTAVLLFSPPPGSTDLVRFLTDIKARRSGDHWFLKIA